MIGNPGEWPDRTHPFAAAVDVQGFGACPHSGEAKNLIDIFGIF